MGEPAQRAARSISRSTRRATSATSTSTGQWIITDLTDGRVELPCIDATLELDALYAKTDDLPRD